MLAIKFHHIRTLIHRPYLCYPHLKGHNAQALLPDQQAQIREYGNTCVQEAQAIAHLMYNVTDTSDIVLNYPWWQMISCLVCAGSVLVLADTFARYEPRGDLGPPAGTSGLGEDIETLVHVLHALSGNSNGAKLACSMMRSIRARSARISVNNSVESSSSGVLPGVTSGTIASEGDKSQDSQVAYSYCGDLGNAGPGLAVGQMAAVGQMGDVGMETNIGDPNSWPMVIPDWMNWSTEFLETFQSSDDSTQGFVRV